MSDTRWQVKGEVHLSFSMGTRTASQKAWLSRKAPEARCRDTCVYVGGSPSVGLTLFSARSPRPRPSLGARSAPLPLRRPARPPHPWDLRDPQTSWASPHLILLVLTLMAVPSQAQRLHCKPASCPGQLDLPQPPGPSTVVQTARHQLPPSASTGVRVPVGPLSRRLCSPPPATPCCPGPSLPSLPAHPTPSFLHPEGSL